LCKIGYSNYVVVDIELRKLSSAFDSRFWPWPRFVLEIDLDLNNLTLALALRNCPDLTSLVEAQHMDKNYEKLYSKTNQLDRHITRQPASHVLCHRSSDIVPLTSLPSNPATGDYRAGNTETCDRALPNHPADFALTQQYKDQSITASIIHCINNSI